MVNQAVTPQYGQYYHAYGYSGYPYPSPGQLNSYGFPPPTPSTSATYPYYHQSGSQAPVSDECNSNQLLHVG